ncbi:helix-turn-helix transcriptional regulator [Streptomyces sp. NPDC004539]|uniref:helix-turn-helix domain-containing protein n=1 Tax=Streptomyces sp. NPDC004539 TaxID=3154280 RepID=UPI0033B1E865
MKARGQTIRRSREESGCGLTEFAQRIGISTSYLSRIERDQANPSPDIVRRIAEHLGSLRDVRAAIREITENEDEESDDDQPAG